MLSQAGVGACVRPCQQPPAVRHVQICRRDALALSAALVLLSPSHCQPARADDEADASLLVVPGVPGERWGTVDATLRLPPGWSRRGGSKAKTTKTVLYTDTYGPFYRYRTLLPRLTSGSGFAVDSAGLQVQGRSGSESVADLGPQSGVDPARAFELSDVVPDIATADVVETKTRKDADKQTYYDWILQTSAGHRVLLSAVISAGGLLLLWIDASAEQWSASEKALRQLQTSFRVAPTAESSMDASARIYSTVKPLGTR